MIIFALASFVLVGFVALSIDAGFLMAERRQVQNAADAAALAAAKSLLDGKTGEISASAKSYGALNADVPQGNVVVHWPPVSGTYTGDNKYVQVTITKQVQKFFVGALYAGDWEVQATATAGVDALPANIAMLALNSNAGGIKLVGNQGISVTGDQATVMSNYNYDLTGNVQITASGFVNTNNGFKCTGNIKIQNQSGCPSTITPEVADPLAGQLSAPTIPNCPAQDDAPLNLNGNTTVTIPAGKHVYHGQGISISGNQTVTIAGGNHEFWFCDGADFQMVGNSKITKAANTSVKMYFIGGDLEITGNTSWSMPSGEYYFVDGDLIFTGNTALVGTDVFLYFKGDARIDTTGNSKFAFSAPTTQLYPGYLPGVVVFADWNNTQTFEWVGNAGTSSSGAVYLPHATLDFVGNANSQVIDGQLIADRFIFTGNAQIGVKYRQVVDFSNPKLYLVE